MDKQKGQVRGLPECEECKARNKTVEDVMKKMEEEEIKEPKKKSLFDFLQSIKTGESNIFTEDKNHNSILTIKIEITWPKDTQDI